MKIFYLLKNLLHKFFPILPFIFLIITTQIPITTLNTLLPINHILNIQIPLLINLQNLPLIFIILNIQIRPSLIHQILIKVIFHKILRKLKKFLTLFQIMISYV